MRIIMEVPERGSPETTVIHGASVLFIVLLEGKE
jgi:hypothetical protein